MKEKTKKLIDEIEEYSGNNLRRKEDLTTLIQAGYSNDQEELIEEICFTSKYIQGLFRVLQRASGNHEIQNINQIKNDLSLNLEKVKKMIGEILTNTNDPAREYFSENYLRMSQTSLLNLTELINDFEWMKKYLNQVKRTISN